MKIRVDLGKRGSINEAIKQLKEYRKELLDKLERLVHELANDGVVVAKSWLSATQGDSQRAGVGLEVDREGNITMAVIHLSGEDALFVEFGAGFYYNAQDTPHAKEFGYGVGTYNPSSENAWNPDGWYYWTGTQRVHSYGTEGTYPLYHAAENIRNSYIIKALDIFRS